MSRSVGRTRVAVRTHSLSVNDVTSEADQITVLISEGEANRRDFESFLDPFLSDFELSSSPCDTVGRTARNPSPISTTATFRIRFILLLPWFNLAPQRTCDPARVVPARLKSVFKF